MIRSGTRRLQETSGEFDGSQHDNRRNDEDDDGAAVRNETGRIAAGTDAPTACYHGPDQVLAFVHVMENDGRDMKCDQCQHDIDREPVNR